MTAITGGEALLGQGFAATACLDTSQGQPGVRLTGSFNPTRADSLGRYGINIYRPGISFIPEQYTGAHSTGLNSQAVALLPQVFAKLGVIIEPNATRDQADLDMLVGATAWVIRMAIDFKLLAPAAPPVDPPAPPPPAPPPVASGLSSPEQRVDELWAWIGQQWPTVRPVAVAALKMFRKAVGR